MHISVDFLLEAKKGSVLCVPLLNLPLLHDSTCRIHFHISVFQNPPGFHNAMTLLLALPASHG